MAHPTIANPLIIIAQVAGSGTSLFPKLTGAIDLRSLGAEKEFSENTRLDWFASLTKTAPLDGELISNMVGTNTADSLNAFVISYPCFSKSIGVR